MDERQKREVIRVGGNGVEFDCSMKQYTTFKVGGPAEALYRANNLDGLKRMIAFLHNEKVPYMVAGLGSNLLVKDRGIEGVVIILKDEMAGIKTDLKDDRILVAGAGLALKELISYCGRAGLSGLEFLSGIPGTVGGAVAMNAGAHGNEIGELIREVQIVTPRGEMRTLTSSELNLSYRHSSIPHGAVITEVIFELTSEDSEVVTGRVTAYLKERKENQPLNYPSAGSVFRNPPDDFAGKLIEEAGLKGKRVGGAMISPKHANFIINTGEAKADDILSLMNMARERVKEKTGVELVPEIKVVGL